MQNIPLLPKQIFSARLQRKGYLQNPRRSSTLSGDQPREQAQRKEFAAKPMPELRPLAILIRGIAVLALALSALSCHREPPRPRNVILILVDTLRADRLGAWGYARPT